MTEKEGEFDNVGATDAVGVHVQVCVVGNVNEMEAENDVEGVSVMELDSDGVCEREVDTENVRVRVHAVVNERDGV